MKLSLKDLKLKDKKVLMRVDYNVPLTKEGEVADDTRIRQSLPSIEYILQKGASLILMSHLGRPKGETRAEFSLAPCAKVLSKLLGKEIVLAPDCVGEEVVDLAEKLLPNHILMLENLRFHSAEEKPEKDPTFAQKLASLADYYVDDAFGAAHRDHSSITRITEYFPESAAMGFLLQKELSFLVPLVQEPPHPFSVLVGGAKISTKIGFLKTLLKKADHIFIGGGMLFTFLKALDHEIGDSLCDEEYLQTAKDFLAETPKGLLHLPVDVVIAKELSDTAETRVIALDDPIPKGWKGVDIGPKTVEAWAPILRSSKTLFWNGPMGVFEIKPFAKGTFALAHLLAGCEGTTVIGGGDSVAAINQEGLSDSFTHLSTGGGAALELIEYGHLPGVDALTER